MRISDWSSDVCSSDLADRRRPAPLGLHRRQRQPRDLPLLPDLRRDDRLHQRWATRRHRDPARHLRRSPIPAAALLGLRGTQARLGRHQRRRDRARSEEHTSELQSLMRISYAVFCLKKKKKDKTTDTLSNKTTSQI